MLNQSPRKGAFFTKICKILNNLTNFKFKNYNKEKQG